MKYLNAEQIGRLAIHVEANLRAFPEPEEIERTTEEDLATVLKVESDGSMEEWELDLKKRVDEDPLLPKYDDVDLMYTETLSGWFQDSVTLEKELAG